MSTRYTTRLDEHIYQDSKSKSSVESFELALASPLSRSCTLATQSAPCELPKRTTAWTRGHCRLNKKYEIINQSCFRYAGTLDISLLSQLHIPSQNNFRKNGKLNVQVCAPQLKFSCFSI